MTRMKAIAAAIAVAATLVAGCTSHGTKYDRRRDAAALQGVPYETTASGERVVLVRDYVELDKVDGRDERHRVQYVWNYDRGVTQRRVYDEQGRDYVATDMAGMTLNATPEELAWMWRTLRADPHWSRVLKDDMQYYGGFSVREAGGPCDFGTRCVHAIVMRDDGRERVLHGIFDLASGRLVDDDVDPTLTGIGQKQASTGEQK